MKDKLRNAIRTVLKGSMYQHVLITDCGSAICQTCVHDNLFALLKDLQSGYYKDLSTLCLAETDGRISCEYCEQELSEYEEANYYMDPDEAEMEEAYWSQYDQDYDF